MAELKRGTKEFQNTLNAMQTRLKQHDDVIKLDQAHMKQAYDEMHHAVRTALSGADDSSLTEIYPANSRQVSPFDKKVASYTMNAMSRSNSRTLNRQNQP